MDPLACSRAFLVTLTTSIVTYLHLNSVVIKIHNFNQNYSLPPPPHPQAFNEVEGVVSLFSALPLPLAAVSEHARVGGEAGR